MKKLIKSPVFTLVLCIAFATNVSAQNSEKKIASNWRKADSTISHGTKKSKPSKKAVKGDMKISKHY